MTRPRPPRPLPLALLLLLPLLAGCTTLQPTPPPAAPQVHPDVVQEAYLVPEMNLSVDATWANVRARGPAVAVPVRIDGAPAAAVYLGPTVSYRADASFASRERQGLQGDLFVQPPLGAFDALRERQGWQRASEADLASRGYAQPLDAFKAASALMPTNRTPLAPGTWALNGSVTARFEPGNVTLASEEGPFVFQRDATGFVAVENRTVLRWVEANNTLYASNDALAEASSADLGLAAVELTWTAGRVDAWVRTPRFRATDLEVSEDRTAKIGNVQLPRVGSVSMVRYDSLVVRDDLVEFRSRNMTFRMSPNPP
jgi:hypothetical protein